MLGLLYRAWSTIHARYWLRQLDSIIDPVLFGSRAGCRASDVWRFMLDQIEWAQHTSEGVAGIILDLSKAFNTLPRYPTIACCGENAWRFMVQGSLSRPVASSCGFPEGCALSCAGMLIVDQVFHAWMRAGNLMLNPVSYVDNWELILTCPSGQCATCPSACFGFCLSVRPDLHVGLLDSVPPAWWVWGSMPRCIRFSWLPEVKSDKKYVFLCSPLFGEDFHFD